MATWGLRARPLACWLCCWAGLSYLLNTGVLGLWAHALISSWHTGHRLPRRTWWLGLASADLLGSVGKAVTGHQVQGVEGLAGPPLLTCLLSAQDYFVIIQVYMFLKALLRKLRT